MCDTLRDLPIGVQSFHDLRHRGFVYVDKTQYISSLVRGKQYFLSRPRRFGKSLFLSTLQAYFEGRKDLFEGLALERAEVELAAREKREAWVKYPVLYLDLNASSYTTILDLEDLLESHLEAWEERYGKERSAKTYSVRFEGVIKRAYEKTGQQVVFLVDEYDKPLLESILDPERYEACRAMLYGFYSNIKNCDRYLRFVLLTGVSRFGKLSVFSGLNNLNDISMDRAYAGICGITEQELIANFSQELTALSTELGLSHEDTIAVLKKRYDGYRFSTREEHVYNPFSLLNVLQKNELSDYWYATGTPTFLVRYLQRLNYFLPDLENDVTMGASGLQISPIEATSPIPILFQAGYLTIREYIPEEGVYRLGFPNEEVKYSFLGNIQPILAPLEDSETGNAVWDFQEAIETGDVAQMMEKIDALLAGVPYDNVNEAKYRERDAQVALYLIFTLLGKLVTTEVYNNKGRADLIVHTDEVIYIFELKLWSAGTPDDAIAQIKAQGYATPYQTSHKKVLLIGASFDEEKRNIGAWVSRQMES